MPPDPKTPEQIVEEARKAAVKCLLIACNAAATARYAKTATEQAEKSIDRLSRVSMLVGRIQGLRWAYDSSGAGWDDEVVSREIQVAIASLEQLSAT